jgi:hypothetical protein
MDFDGPLDDGEAKPGASVFARPSLIGAIEAVKDAHLFFRRDAGALVGDGYLRWTPTQPQLRLKQSPVH